MYFDHAATTQVSSRTINVMANSMAIDFGNPSSIHAFGLKTERAISKAREVLAKFLYTDSKHLIFTSGATESSNLVLKSVIEHTKPSQRHMITTQIEHPSVLEVFKYYELRGYTVTYLPVDAYGVVNREDLKSALTHETFLVSMMMVNNEVGSIQNIQELCKITHQFNQGIFFHTDAVQALGKFPINLEQLGVDGASFSAHKLHGPKGIGLLYVKHPHKLHPLQVGGGQEGNLRSGTQNVPGILGFSEAILEFQEMRDAYVKQLEVLKTHCLERLVKDFSDYMLLSPLTENHSNSIVSIAFKHVRSEVLVHELERQGIFVSSGSACSSHKKGAVSHVVSAMRIPKAYTEGVIRLSFSGTQTVSELDEAMDCIRDTIRNHREMTNRRR